MNAKKSAKRELKNKKNFVPIVQRLFAMQRYGGGMLYGFEPMTNKSPRHNFTAAPGLMKI